MKKIIRLTESDLTRLVRKVIKEQTSQNNIVNNRAEAKKFADEIKSGVSTFGHTDVETLHSALTRLLNRDYSIVGEVYKLLGIKSMEEYLDDEFMAYNITGDYTKKHSYDKVLKGIHDALGGQAAQKIMSAAKKLDERWRKRV